MLATVAEARGGRMKFGAKLQELRQKANLSQPEFAGQVGLSVGAVRDYEQGRRLPSWPAIVRIARALNVPVDEFSDCDEVAEEAESNEDATSLDSKKNPKKK